MPTVSTSDTVGISSSTIQFLDVEHLNSIIRPNEFVLSSSSSPSSVTPLSSSSSPPPPLSPPLSLAVKDAFSFGYLSYDNLSFSDVEARNEFGTSMLDAVIELLGATATAEENCARTLDSVAQAFSSRVRGSGQGISYIVDGSVQKQGSFLNAGLQAIGLGSFFTSSNTSNSINSSNDNTSPIGGNGAGAQSNYSVGSLGNGYDTSSRTNLLSTVGNGPSSIGIAVESLFKQTAKQSAQRLVLATNLRKLYKHLHSIKDFQTVATSQLLARAREAARGVEMINRELERAHSRVKAARRDLLDAEERYMSGKNSAGAVQGSELLRRQNRVTQCMADLEAGERDVMRTSEELVATRRRRDDELTVSSRQLQRMDRDRMIAIAKALEEVSSVSIESSRSSQASSLVMEDAVASVSVESDMRMFTYQRRVSMMLQEQLSLQDARAVRSNALSTIPSTPLAPPIPPTQSHSNNPFSSIRNVSATSLSSLTTSSSTNHSTSAHALATMEAALRLNVVPQPHPVAVSMRHNRDFITAEKALSPICDRWVKAIFEGKGSEALRGKAVQQLISKKVTESESETESSSSSSSFPPQDSSNDLNTSTDGEEFEVEILSNHAARIAFLRSLNLQRSKRQDAGQKGFERLARVLWWMLDACEAQEDVCCARMVMVMAETFFEISPSTKMKRFLQAVLKAHTVWTHEAYWEEVFYQSFYDAVKVTSNPYGSITNRQGQVIPDTDRSQDVGCTEVETGDGTDENNTTNVPSSPVPNGPGGGGGGGGHSSSAPSPSHRPGTTDWSYAYVQTLFSQLAAIAMNMITFGLPSDRVGRIITSLAVGNGLPTEMAAALQETVKTYSAQE